jgi:hypothetical protein
MMVIILTLIASPVFLRFVDELKEQNLLISETHLGYNIFGLNQIPIFARVYCANSKVNWINSSLRDNNTHTYTILLDFA